jgi:hypothetical protein
MTKYPEPPSGKVLVIFLAGVLFAAGCAPKPPDPAVEAEALVRARFGAEVQISVLSKTVDGLGYCGMLVEDRDSAFVMMQPFIVENGRVSMLNGDPEPYRRCPGYVAPNWMTPIA